MPNPQPYDPREAERIARSHIGRAGALLPVLHEIQARFGHIPPGAVPMIAEVLNLSRAEVHGVISFYHDFRTEPAGRKVVKLCLAEACQARGAREVTAKVEAALELEMGKTAQDGSVSLLPVYCLGLCGNGPAALVEDEPYADLAGRGFERCLRAVRS